MGPPQSCDKFPEFEALGAATLAAVGAQRVESDGVLSRQEFMAALEQIRAAILPPHVRAWNALACTPIDHLEATNGS